MTSARTIWRTVVVAGAMIGSPLYAMAGDPPAPEKNAPSDTQGTPPPIAKDKPTQSPQKQPEQPKQPTKPSGKPETGSGAGSGSGSGSAAKRPRADNERPTGRGFVLS